jgi:hypothetical protein
LNKLVSSGLVEKAKTYFWSIKGKKIPVYKLSNKYIIIAPKSSSSKIMKTFLPVALISGVVALIIRYFYQANSFSVQVADRVSEKAAETTSSLQTGAVNAATSSLSIWDKILAIPSWEWFLIGAGFAIVLILILNYRRLNK